MPFPPTFDAAWAETFPPDTQAANLLGDDIRKFKADIRQRLALLSGTFANRPTNMDAVFGGSGFGVLYFATDTAQIFQWSGSAWVDVSSSISSVIKYADPIDYIFLTTTVGDGNSITIPANTLKNKSHVRIFGYGINSGGTGNVALPNLVISGNNAFSTQPFVTGTETFTWSADFIIDTGSANNLKGWVHYESTVSGPFIGQLLFAVTLSSAIIIKLTLSQHNAPGSTFTFRGLAVEVFA